MGFLPRSLHQTQLTQVQPLPTSTPAPGGTRVPCHSLLTILEAHSAASHALVSQCPGEERARGAA